jgi:hypothetical protein
MHGSEKVSAAEPNGYLSWRKIPNGVSTWTYGNYGGKAWFFNTVVKVIGDVVNIIKQAQSLLQMKGKRIVVRDRFGSPPNRDFTVALTAFAASTTSDKGHAK